MSADPRPVGEDDLQAWIDGRVPPARVAMVEDYLAAHPDAAARAAQDRQTSDNLRARLAPIADELIPARLRIANLVAASRIRWRGRLIAAAAAIAWVGLGGTAGWFVRDLVRPGGRGDDMANSATQDALAAFLTFSVEVAHPVEVRAADKPHLVQWLSRRLNRTVVVPDLADQGFRLMGGRLLPTEAEPAALLMYDDDRGTRLTLYTRVSRAPFERSGFRPARQGNVATLGWTEGGQVYVVSARADPTRVLAVAQTVEGQVRSPADGRL